MPEPHRRKPQPEPEAEPSAEQLTAPLLETTEIFLAALEWDGNVLRVQLPVYVLRAGYSYPARSVDEVMFWAAVQDRLQSGPPSSTLIRFAVALSDRVVSVRVRRTGQQSWALAWSPVSDGWLDESGRQLLPVLGGRPVAAVLLSLDGVVLSVNEQYKALFPVSVELVPGQRWPDLLPPDMAPAADQLLAELNSAAVDRILASAQPQPRWFRVFGAQAVQAGTTLPVLVLQVEELTRAGEVWSLLGQLIREPLTGLYNRRAFFDIAELDIAGSSPFVGVVFADIRRFKRINEVWGQFAGDRCLIEVARWLSSLAAPGDLVIRLAGDEFVVLCTAESEVAAKLQRSSDRTLALEGGTISLSLQAGWARRQPAASLLSTTEQAERALGLAKRESWRTVVGWTEEISSAAEAAAGAEEAVQQAITARQEAVHFQPVVDLAAGRVAGFEALVRLGGPAAGLPTDQIIAASHRLGLTPHFAEAVFDLAFSEGRVLQGRLPGAYIAVNISREFLGSGLAIDTVLRCAERAGVALSDVLVELTEDLADGVSTDVLLTELGHGVERGLRMVIDDFGRGETSLSLLRTLPVSAIKLDRSLLPLDDDDQAWAFVAGTVSLLRTMTQRLIAEGIETELQCRRLRELGVELQQGYLFGQPQPLSHWLEHQVTLPRL